MLAAGVVLAVPAFAENTIQFSKPVDLESVNRGNLPPPLPKERRSVVGGVVAPSDLFSNPQDDLPLPAPVMMMPQTASM